jgi:exodeoxyribonuclease V beta subunit
VEDWAALDEVRILVDAAVSLHGIDSAQRAHAESLVWSALTTPVSLGKSTLAGFASVQQCGREMEFAYPLPKAEKVRTGYVTGSLDFVFEHDGRVYFVDWKSDTLSSYAPEAVARRVAEHYSLQARLYSLAMTKLLGVSSETEFEARFGGYFYCFLRGFTKTDGLFFARPSWNDLVSWERELVDRPELAEAASSVPNQRRTEKGSTP